MQKKFLANLGLLLLLNILIKPVFIFGIDLTIQNEVGTDYGFYFTLFNFSFLFNILLDVGITNFNNRNIAQNSHLLNKHFSRILILKFLLAMVYFIITFVIAVAIGYDPDQLKFLILLGINQFLISLIFYLRSNISGLLLFKTDSFLSVLDRIILIAICSVLLWGNITGTRFQIEWFVYAQTAAYGITALIAFLIVIRKAAFRKLTWNWPFFIMIVRKSFPFALLVLLMTFYNRVDAVLLERILEGDTGKEQVTVYASAFRILDAVNMVAFLFSVLLLPIFSRMLKNGEPVAPMIKLAFTLLISVAAIISLGSFFYSTQLMDLFYVDHVEQSARVFRIMMFGFASISVSYIFGTLLTANGSLTHLNLIATGSVILSLVLNLILIPRVMAVGSAWASVITQSVSALAQVITAIILFKFKVKSGFVIKILAFLGGVTLLNWVSTMIPVDWKISFLIMGTTSLGYAFLIRFINLRSILSVFQVR
jgi:O-antigen/teichoic acid export membrane protein